MSALRPLKVLVIEDDLSDARLLERELRQNDLLSEIRIVEEEAEYINALKEFSPDLILSDYFLPMFNGMEALKIVRQLKPFTPFLLVTGNLNETIAVECMKAGADDYLLKDNLKRLGPAIIEAVRKKELEVSKLRVERKLIETERIFNSFLDYCPIYFFFKDAEARPIRLSSNYEKLLGLPVMDAIGKSMFELFPPDLAASMISDDLSILESNKPLKVVEKLADRIYETTKFPILENGKPTFLAGFTVDVTDRIVAEEALRTSENRFRQIAEIAGEWIWEVNPEGIYTYISRMGEVILGYSADEIVGKKHFYDFFMPEKREAIKAAALSYFAERKSFVNFENENLRSDGRIVILETTGVPMIGEDGELLGYRGVDRDITQRKIAEKEILKLYHGIGQSPALVAITDINGDIQYVNRKFTETLGYKAEELKGRVLRILKPGHNSDEVYRDLWEHLLTGKEWKGENLNRKKNGEFFWESVLISPVKDNNNNISNYIFVSQDISKRKQMEQELIKAKEAAEESNRLKTAFLQNISHEIRTPMNAIMGFSSLLREAVGDDERLKTYTDIISNGSNQLLGIITDIVNIATIEAGQEKIRLGVFNINSVTNTLIGQFRLRAEARGIELSFLPGLSDEEATIESDETKFVQIVTNLLNNAFKYTESGRIVSGYRKDKDSIEFFVRDTGIGIPEQFRERIFERFFQVGNRLSENAGGTGLGLSLSKAYVELMGGRIWISDNENGKGSAFFFTIPYTRAASVKQPAPVELKPAVDDKHPEKTILVAEDEENNFTLLTYVLSKHNFRIIRASNGLEALEIVGSGEKIDLILMDIKMPEMDGFEATLKLRGDGNKTPIIALTAYARESDMLKFREAGFNDYITKPFDKEKLLEAIERFAINR